ncbi:integrase core domain-containing protein [Mesorhizobium sp. M0601]|uniref:integrase core domain-containing protein n=1 Tax=Mesorhizobium sp. M0601 TaxID=2956969 RepID=UPI00333D90DE
MQNGYVEFLQRSQARRAPEREPVLGLDHARNAIAEWREDFNTARPHSSLAYQTRQPMLRSSPQPATTLC